MSRPYASIQNKVNLCSFEHRFTYFIFFVLSNLLLIESLTKVYIYTIHTNHWYDTIKHKKEFDITYKVDSS